MEFVLTPDQLFVLTWVSQGITQVLKIAAGLIKRPIKDEYKLGLVFVVSTALAYLWVDVAFPPLSDPMAFAVALVTNVGIVMAAASVVYSRLTGLVLGFLDDKVLSRIPFVKNYGPLLRPSGDG